VNFFWSIKHGRKVTSDNPWDATTLEWATPTPPPHGNFTKPMTVYRGPYDYSVRGAKQDFCAQNEAVVAQSEKGPSPNRLGLAQT